MKLVGVSLALGLAIWNAAPAEAQDLDAARKLFVNACGTCHAVEPEAAARQGPNLRGVLGRKSASLPGFKYSDALKSADWVWDEKRLDVWITNSQEALPGTTMLYRQANEDRRAAMISYLKSISQ